MSNQVFSNETQVYPIISTAQAIKGGGISGVGDYIDVSTSNIVKGQSLVVTDTSGAGTYSSPFVGEFMAQVRDSEDESDKPAGAGVVTALYNIPFVGLKDGVWLIETYLVLENGAVGSDQYYATLEYYDINGGGAVLYNTNNTVLTVAESGQATQTYSRKAITMPAGGAGTLGVSVSYSSVASATATGKKYNVKLTYLGL